MMKTGRIKLPGALVATAYPTTHALLKPIHEFDLGSNHYVLKEYYRFVLRVMFEGQTLLLLLNPNIDSIPLIRRILKEEDAYALMRYVNFIVVLGKWKLIHTENRWAKVVLGALSEGLPQNVYLLMHGNDEDGDV